VFQNVKQVAKDYKHIIIVHEHQQSKTIRSHFGSMEGAKFIETIHFDQFIINKAEHFGTEKSKIVPADDEDFANFIRISGLQLSQLPVKRTQDPMMVWLGAQHGDIILTTRLYHSITKQHIYEFVSNDAGKADDADSDED
jgi:DNA-directed RNA polymerase subunit H (RpoH/RPB5)